MHVWLHAWAADCGVTLPVGTTAQQLPATAYWSSLYKPTKPWTRGRTLGRNGLPQAWTSGLLLSVSNLVVWPAINTLYSKCTELSVREETQQLVSEGTE